MTGLSNERNDGEEVGERIDSDSSRDRGESKYDKFIIYLILLGLAWRFSWVERHDKIR